MIVSRRTFLAPDTWEGLREEYDVVMNMSCKPDIAKFPKFRRDDIIDENQSVKWNRDYVEHAIARREEEITRLNRVKNQAISDVVDKICKLIQEYVGHDISMGKARLIWSTAYDYGHSNGTYEIFIHLERLIEFAMNILE